jgi:hypothetical protein
MHSDTKIIIYAKYPLAALLLMSEMVSTVLVIYVDV